MVVNETKSLVLPLSLAQPVDVNRLLREVTTIQEGAHQDKLRGAKQDKLQISEKLNELASSNKLDVTDSEDLKTLAAFLDDLKAGAPVMHMSFSSEPANDFITKLVSWLRKEIDPKVLLVVGMEPSLGAGCMVRTNNKSFDFSLSQRLKKSRELLVGSINKASVPAKQA